VNGDGQWGVPGYSEVRELGAGATGRVVLARRAHDDAEVAIKYLSDRLRGDMSFVARFRHEARLLGTLRGPHNARLVDYVETGDGAAIVMELVNGVSLRELLRSEGPTGPEAALTVLKGSLRGLAAAHAIGVVHRDFKPENVIVQDDGDSKLVDFGIAVAAGEGTSAVGTPPYMAPEQWSGSPASPATDVYAATVVFFECLTGGRPFHAANVAALAHQHLMAPPPVDEVPEPLRGLVQRGLAKHETERPPSAEAFLDELEVIAADAYGADWEERGRRRLTSLVGLLFLLLPSPPDPPAEVHTTLAETRFGGPGRAANKVKGTVRGTVRGKVAIGTACAGVVIAVGLVLVNTLDGEPAALTAQTSTVPPATLTPAAEPPATELLDTGPTEEPTQPATEEPPPTPGPAPTSTFPVTAPTTAEPTPSPTTGTPTPRPTRSRTKTPAPTPSESPEPRLSGKSDVNGHGTTSAATPTPTPIPTTPPPPTTRPSTRPSSTPSTTAPQQTPTPDDSGTDDGTPTSPGRDSPTPAEPGGGRGR
jgi:eukaryotic-like serine/threonine-protein kinase